MTASRRRILLVEDDEDTRQLLGVALSSQGYDVRQGGDASEGLTRLREGRFDMVLTDYDLPGKTGAAMLREASAAGILQGAATLIVTAHPDPEPVPQATVVRKPLDLDRFLLQVRRILDARPEAEGTATAAKESPDGAAIHLALYV